MKQWLRKMQKQQKIAWCTQYRRVLEKTRPLEYGMWRMTQKEGLKTEKW